MGAGSRYRATRSKGFNIVEMPCKVVVVPENATSGELDQIAQTIREALAVPEEVHNARWRAYFAANGIPDPQIDPEGFHAYHENERKKLMERLNG